MTLDDLGLQSPDKIAEAMNKASKASMMNGDETPPIDFDKVVPCYDGVLVTFEKPVIEEEEKTTTGIVLSTKSKALGKYVVAEVVRCGCGNWSETLKDYVPLPFEIGDKILIKRGSGMNFVSQASGKLYSVVRAPEILFKIEE